MDRAFRIRIHYFIHSKLSNWTVLFSLQKLFILTIVLGFCAAATVTDVEKIKIPQSDEGQDLKAVESTNRQFGHGGL